MQPRGVHEHHQTLRDAVEFLGHETAFLWNDGCRYARVYVGAPAGDGHGGNATVYIDDIRFRPVDARVCSFYYDAKIRNRIACIGPNNFPIPCGDVERVLFTVPVDSVGRLFGS